MTFVSHAWCHALGIREVIFRELCVEFLFTSQFNWECRIWIDGSIFSFRLGGVAHSCSLVELGKRLGIYFVEDVDHPLPESYLDSCILSKPREYNQLDVWAFQYKVFRLLDRRTVKVGTYLDKILKHFSMGYFPICHIVKVSKTQCPSSDKETYTII